MEGYFQYANVPAGAFISGSLTLTHGISPNICTLNIVPLNFIPAPRGPLKIGYGGQQVVMPDCRLLDAGYQVRADGFQVQTLRIADRRWKWQFGWIRGTYNVREGDNRVRLTRKKEPRKLAELCLKAMNETKYDISALPNDELPYVEWDGYAAPCLAQLCLQLGCRIFLNPLNNLPTIVQAGKGQPLPTRLDMISDSLDLDPPELPDKFVFLAGQTLFQDDLPLEPVLETPNGELKPMDEVHYGSLQIQQRGWKHEPLPDLPSIPDKHKKLAQRCAWKYYRIKTPHKIPWGTTIKSIPQIAPLETTLVEPKKREGKWEERPPAIVIGSFYAGDHSGRTAAKRIRCKAGEVAQYEQPFSIDGDRGLVIFNDPVYERKNEDGTPLGEFISPDQGFPFPAKLYLRTAFGVRHPETWAWDRTWVIKKPSGSYLGTADYIIDRRDVALRRYKKYTAQGVQDRSNLTEVKAAGKYYIDQALREFQLMTPGTRTYAGLVLVPLDGAIHQVTWQVDGAGYTTTSISRNREEITPTLTWKEKVQRDQIKAMIQKANAGGK